MQTILGSTGVIGRYLSQILNQYTDKLRLVSRNPVKVNDSDETVAADLRDCDAVLKSVYGSDVVYLTAGIKYDKNIWKDEWPRIMKNVINACERYNAKLVFFSNLYAYGKVDGWMSEDTPLNPVSIKGKVRMGIENMLTDEIGKGKLTAAIVKASDFYGPASMSVVTELVFNKLSHNKKPLWLGNPGKKHSLTYVKDAALATAIVGNNDSAFNQVWHAPTDKNALSGRQIISLAANAFNGNPDFTVIPVWMLKIIGTFNTIIRENNEMMYQLENDFLLDSSKFENTFKIFPTSYEKGFAVTAGYMKNGSSSAGLPL